MTDNKLVNRIPFEEIETAKVWTLPSLSNGKTKVVPSVKKQNAREETAKKAGQEIIEEIPQPALKPLTAEQLQHITEQAEKEGREHGYQEGLQKGLAEGEKKGLQKGEQKAYAETKAALEDQTRRFQQIADALLQPLATQSAKLENIILDMAVNIARHLLNRELTEDPSGLFHLVERAVNALPAGAKNIRIYLNPDDVELAHEAFANMGRNWTFFSDAKMARGGCRVETDQSLVDYSVEQRLKQMLEQVNLLGELADEEETSIADYTPPEPVATPQAPTALEAKAESPVEMKSLADTGNPSAAPENYEIREDLLDSEEEEGPDGHA